MFDDQVERKSAEGLFSHLDWAMSIREEGLAGLNDEVQGEAANDFYLTAEAAKKPRVLGISQMHDVVMEPMWFDDMVVYRKPGTNEFWDWWDPNNKPPENRSGKLKHGVDWQKIRLPLRSEMVVPAGLIQKFGGDEARARRECWEQAARNYAGNTIYKIDRGDSEQWAGGFEPAVFLDQKPRASHDHATPDLHLVFLDIAKRQLRELGEKEDKEPLSKQEKKMKAFLVRHIERILSAGIVRARPQFLPKDWRDTQVLTAFRGFSAVGREVFKKMQTPIARALGNSRRQQSRMMRIIGIEVPEEGASQPDENSIVYSRMSEAYDLNPYLANAILTRSGLNVELKIIAQIQLRLNEWREMHGLLPIEFKPFSDRPQPPQTEEVDEFGEPIKRDAKPGQKKGAKDLSDAEKDRRYQEGLKKTRADRQEMMIGFPPPVQDVSKRKTMQQWDAIRSKAQKIALWEKELEDRGLNPDDDSTEELLNKVKKHLRDRNEYDDDFFEE